MPNMPGMGMANLPGMTGGVGNPLAMMPNLGAPATQVGHGEACEGLCRSRALPAQPVVGSQVAAGRKDSRWAASPSE